jgi:ADP-ribosylglycohydrolase
MDHRSTSHRETDRALGALLGVALGDAMGMPSQTLSRERIVATYGTISDLVDAAPDHPVSGGLRAGTVTDDTEQSLLLARQLLGGDGPFDEERWARSLLAWEKDTHARGVNDLLGPSTKRAIDLLLRGVPASETGRFGTTNGAAMRIVPVGISMPLEPLSRFVAMVAETCRVTHNTSEAIGSAVAVAAIVSAGVSGSSFEDGLEGALAGARAGEQMGTPPVSGRISERIADALDLCRTASGPAGIAAVIGTSVSAMASVPMAFAIARLAGGDAWKAATMSANIGDDTDTIGAISCGMVGACSGAATLPQALVARIVAVNHLDLGPIVRGLLKLRSRRAELQR